MKGAVTVQEIGDAKIHSYISPEKSGSVAGHIVEGPKSLVVIDAQFLRPFAKELRAYADGLKKPIVPKGDTAAGKKTIDGITYVFETVKDAEDGAQLVITLPELNVLIARDLVFNKVHLYVGNDTLEGWKKALSALKKKTGIKTVLAGHGKPGGPALYDQTLAYLDVAEEALKEAKKGGHDVKPLLLKKFPDYKAAFLLDISNGMLFKTGK